MISPQRRAGKPSLRNRLEEAKRRGFVIARRSEDVLASDYFLWCEQQDPPRSYIRVRPRQRWAQVDLDQITTRRTLTDWQVAEVRAILSLASKKPTTVHAGRRYAYARWIPIESAELVAALIARAVGAASSQ